MIVRRSLVVSLSTAALAALTLAPSPAAARIGFPNNIPNGNTFSCVACHNSSSGGAAAGWNALGDTIFVENGGTADDPPSLPLDAGDPAFSFWNDAICNDDSDGDGATNGEELGDPDCVWVRGQAPDSTEGITDPSDPDDTPAGAEGEGEGDAPPGGCAASTTGTGTPLGALSLAFLSVAALVRRRR